jgi:hypothetical protein
MIGYLDAINSDALLTLLLLRSADSERNSISG